MLGDSGQVTHEIVERIRVAIGELRLEMRPDPFIGVQFGRIPREPLEMETGTSSLQGLHLGPLVNAAAVQEDDDVAAEVPQEGAQKDRDLDGADVLAGMQMQVESEPAAFRADGDGRDRRNFVAPVAMPHDRGLAARCPGAPDVGNQQEAAFVGECQVGLQALRVFFIVVQRYRFQRSMAASSRSSACRSGF